MQFIKSVQYYKTRLNHCLMFLSSYLKSGIFIYAFINSKFDLIWLRAFDSLYFKSPWLLAHYILS